MLVSRTVAAWIIEIPTAPPRLRVSAKSVEPSLRSSIGKVLNTIRLSGRNRKPEPQP